MNSPYRIKAVQSNPISKSPNRLLTKSYDCEINRIEIGDYITLHLASDEELEIDKFCLPDILSVWVRVNKEYAQEAVLLSNKKFRVTIESIDDD